MHKLLSSVLIAFLALTSLGVKVTVMSETYHLDLPSQSSTTDQTATNPNPDDDAYPTLTLLEQTTIPDADLVDLAIRLLHVETIIPPPVDTPVRQIGDRARFNASNSGSGYALRSMPRCAP